MKQRLPLMFTVVTLILFSGGAVASAATARQGSQPRNHYCVAWAVPIGSSQQGSMQCYRTFSASISSATGGRVRLPAGAKPGSITPDAIHDVGGAPTATYVLGIDFDDAGYSNNDGSITFIQSAKCGYYQFANMPSGWNDRVSSATTYSGCLSVLYQNSNFCGSTLKIPKNSGVANFGSFNDQASSQKWCASTPC